MDELLKALQKGDEERINRISCELFITEDGRINFVEINVFERYAPCTIFPIEYDSFGWLIGGIRYNDKVYSFG
jgi:hypothetical protein